MTLPKPELVAHVELHRAKNGFALPIPSTCEECSEPFPSKTALAQHEREVHPKEPPFNDQLREKYLTLVRSGRRPLKAARDLKVSSQTVKRAMKVDPTFAEAVALAEEEYAEEVEEVLVERALAGDPWAVKEFISKRSKSRWGDDKTLNINVSGTINHRADLLPHEQDIVELQQTVRERARLNGSPIALNAAIIETEIAE